MRLALAVAAAIGAAGCDRCASWEADVAGLRTLERLDPAAMAAQAIARGDFSVLAVNDEAEPVPGIADQECALTRIRKRVIDPTPDALCTAEHYRLKRAAALYAERYNAVIRDFRRSKELPSCDAAGGR
jgi:hypothetical protein